MFYIGHLRPFQWSEVKHISHPNDMVDINPGDILEIFGHVLQWDEDCVPLELCERWRHSGDPLCDAALREVFSHPSSAVGKDLLQSLQEHLGIEGRASATEAFLSEVMQPPPVGLRATEHEVIAAQELFLDDSIQIMQALLHYSLAGGLASSRIVRTLETVSYLLPHIKKGKVRGRDTKLSLADLVSQIPKSSTDGTFVRLVETMQFVLDVMACTAPLGPQESTSGESEAETVGERGHDRLAYLLPGGEGWKSAVRVRLLHGVARWRVQLRCEAQTDSKSETMLSVPISQEEVAATLASFSTIPMWCLQRLHLPPSHEQISAYLALWRHVGYYMGVSPPILLRHFSTTNAADKFIATVALNLFLEETPDPSPTPVSSLLRRPTIPILVAVSRRPPLNTSLEYNIALTTHLLGEPLAAHLGLPRTTLRTRLRMHAFLLLQRIPHYVAQWYPRRAWVEKRRAVLSEGMVHTVRWSMGMRRTAFRPRTRVHDADSEQFQGRNGEGLVEGGELADGVKESESVRRNPARGKMLTRLWKEVFLEMVAVCVVVGMVSVGLLYVLLSRVVLPAAMSA